jgi:RNA polymerase sigma-70 factor (ECF subfamily)
MATTKERVREKSLADFGKDETSQWENVMRRYNKALRGYFASRVRNPADIDDLVQEVFVQLLRRGSDRPIEHVRHYLFRVASSVLCDQGRRMKSRRDDAHDSYDEELHGRANDITPTRIIIGEQALACVAAALRELPQRTQDVFFLRGIRQRKHEEVARMLGISQRVVHKHMSRALKHLAAALKDAE